VCFRSNVWNIGAEGQFVIGALAAGGVACWPTRTRALDRAAHPAGRRAGRHGVGGDHGLLRDRFNASEILVSLMLVYVASRCWATGLWALEGPGGLQLPADQDLRAVTQIPRLMQGSRVNIGCCSRWPARRAVGVPVPHPPASPSRWAGWRRRRRAMPASRRAGAVDGAADLRRRGRPGRRAGVAGPIGQLTPYVPAGYGFAAIIVAFVGRLHPVGMVFSAILMSMFYIGGELAQSRLGLPKSLTGVFQGLLLFTLLACDTLIAYRIRWPPPRVPRRGPLMEPTHCCWAPR
jgi:simple sugar transport system permease protein